MTRLNRTMQYGNLYTATDKEGENASLNRTMQYGNWEGEKLIGTGIKCLNRTMQYGNFIDYYTLLGTNIV